MILRKIRYIAISAFALFFTVAVNAQNTQQIVEVVATGYGSTVREATKAALRSAVEAVVGTIIDATTLVENDKLIEDEILSYSAGMISSAKTIGEPKKSADGIYCVKVKASVKKGRLEEKLKAASAVNVTLDGADLFARMTAAKENLADAEKMIETVLAKHIDCVVAETVPGENGKSPIDLDPKTGEVIVNVRVRVDHQKYIQFVNEVVEKIGPMATSSSRLLPSTMNDREVDYGDLGDSFDFLIMTNPKTGSALMCKFEKNKAYAIAKCMDVGSVAVSVALRNSLGQEIAEKAMAMNDSKASLGWSTETSVFSCRYNEREKGESWGVIMPYYSGADTWNSDGYHDRINQPRGIGTYRISLGKFTPEELKSVGKLELKVGHMKKNNFIPR